MEGPAKRSKKKIIFWDKDGFDGGLPSVEVLLNWMTTEGNYDKWRGSDRNNGNTKEFLLKEIYRLAQDFLSQTGSGITDETTLRAEVLKRCPYYYRLQDVMLDRPSAHPLITSDDLDAAEQAGGDDTAVITQKGEKRPLAFMSSAPSSQTEKRQKVESVEALLARQTATLLQRSETRSSMLELKQRQVELMEHRNSREEKEASLDIALKQVQLEAAKRESVVQLLLSRKKLKDNGVSDNEIDTLLP
eukprot:jgi/Phyca11/59458/gw1.48.305.1